MTVIVQSNSNTRGTGTKFHCRHIARRDNGKAYNAKELDTLFNYSWKVIAPDGSTVRFTGGKKGSAFIYFIPPVKFPRGSRYNVYSPMKLKTDKEYTIGHRMFII